MPAVQISGDLSVFDIDIEDDGTYADYLGLIQNVTFRGELDTVEAAPIARPYSRQQPIKKGGVITAPLMSVVSGSAKVSSLDFTALTIFGQDYEPYLQNGELTIGWGLSDATAVGDFWKWPHYNGTKTLSFTGTILVPSTAALGSQFTPTRFFSATPSDHEGSVSMTLNGVTITAAMTLKSLEHAFNRGDLQAFNVSFEANSPDTGTYPAAPTGTTTILERALNSVNVHRLRLTTHASEGQQYAGNGILSQARIVIPNADLIKVEYEWQTQGAWTSTPN